MRKVVFIVSPAYSGSTLLGLILGSHSSAFCLGEPNGIFKCLEELQRDSPRICGVCPDDCRFWNRPAILRMVRSYFRTAGRYKGRRRVFGSWWCNIYEHLFAWTRADVLIDTSKDSWWVNLQLTPFWHWGRFEPVLLMICRDGRASVNSRLRRDPRTNVCGEAARWVEEMGEQERLWDRYHRLRRIRVRYEDLGRCPEEIIRQICAVLGLTFESSMLRYWEHDHHLVRGNLGTRFLIYRHRERLGGHKAITRWQRESNRTDLAHYDYQGLAIKLDERWRDELSRVQLDEFESIGGEVNRRYGYGT